MIPRHPYLRPLGPYQIDLVQAINRRQAERRREQLRRRLMVVEVALVALAIGLVFLTVSSMAGGQ